MYCHRTCPNGHKRMTAVEVHTPIPAVLHDSVPEGLTQIDAATYLTVREGTRARGSARSTKFMVT